MNEYHKIQTIFKRDPDTEYKTLLMGEYSMSEFEYLKNNTWIFTEKVDGTNIRVMFDNSKITFAGKTDKADIPKPLMQFLNDKFLPLESDFVQMFHSANVCLYGEGYGPKIQSGGKYRKDHSFVLFDIKIGDWWLKREDVEDIANTLNIEIVPIIGQGDIEDMVKAVKDGFYSLWGDFIAEGIVARPQIELKTRSGERIIAKLKHKDFRDH